MKRHKACEEIPEPKGSATSLGYSSPAPEECSMHVGKKHTEEEQKKALGELMIAIRKDLFSNKRITKTRLISSDFEFLGPR